MELLETSLNVLRDSLAVHLPKAEAKANQELDRFIEEMDPVRVVTLR